jgi:hypothetical protein
MLATFDRVLVTAGATGMKCHTGLRRFGGLMLMAFMAWFYHGITRLGFMMAGRALCDTQIGMFLMGKSDYTQFSIKLDYNFICRDCHFPGHLFSDHIANKQ